MKKLKYANILTLSLLSAGLCSCAGKFTGGGTIDSFTATIESLADSNDKATFGFNLHAIDSDGDGLVYDFFDGFDPDDTFKGKFQFNDHGAGVAFHGVVDGAYFRGEDDEFAGCLFPCERPTDYTLNNSGVLRGTYTPVRKKLGPGGEFEVLVVDHGEPGISDPEDEIWVWVGSGVFAGYSNRIDTFEFQKITGGNLKYHPEKDDDA